MDSVQRAVAAWHIWRTPAPLLRVLREDRPGVVEEAYAGLDDAVQRDLLQSATRLEEAGIGALIFGGDDYPELLNALRSPPAILMSAGNTALLHRPAVGICGSRSASAEGLSAARSLAQALAGKGYVTVAGNAVGVDAEAQQGALDAGGGVITVLPEGITHARLRHGNEDGVSESGQLLVLSQFPPAQPWSVGGAMARNGLIAALTQALVVIEASDRGGTLAAGETALAMGRPVLALEFDAGTPLGNAMLIKKGALPVRTPRAVTDFVENLSTASPPGAPEDQLSLTL
jgi:DNA processing protein